MNIYHCLTEEIMVFQEVIADRSRYEVERVFNLVAAPSRGKAKSLFVQANKRDVEWTTHMVIRKLGNLDCQAGVVEDSEHPAWHLLPDYDEYLALTE